MLPVRRGYPDDNCPRAPQPADRNSIPRWPIFGAKRQAARASCRRRIDQIFHCDGNAGKWPQNLLRSALTVDPRSLASSLVGQNIGECLQRWVKCVDAGEDRFCQFAGRDSALRQGPSCFTKRAIGQRRTATRRFGLSLCSTTLRQHNLRLGRRVQQSIRPAPVRPVIRVQALRWRTLDGRRQKARCAHGSSE